MFQGKVLISGGSGFIGTNLMEKFIEDGYQVLNIDINKSKIQSQSKYHIKIDITNYQQLKQCVVNFNPEYIVHLAAKTDLNGNTLNDYQANTLGVENLMKIVNELPSLKKIIITSSMLVCHAGYYPKSQFDFAPKTIYGVSKVQTEKIVWANKPSCDWAIIRPTSIWGPWFGVPYKNFFDMIITKKFFHIGNKSCTKTYGYVGNAIYQIEQILFSETIDEENKVFYIGDYQSTNIEEWGNEIANQLGYKIIKIPFLFIKLAALIGDILKIIGINFPMSSFRLQNMTTDNIVNLSYTKKIAPDLPYTRIQGIKNTLQWINKYRK
ncbi:MAG: NAD(P)-dependent oxidoreductase [Parabacteroides sp.]|nr:NAD(P)-dependent oxidoreductase [Parabacteroides sp.]MDD3508458.1 NAD(P)-dependent oxidoreductase [Parabacteroides sp.]